MKAGLAALLAAWAVAVPLVSGAQPAPPVEKPAIKVGDRWKFVQIDPFTKTERPGNEQVVVETLADGFVVAETDTQGATSHVRFDAEWNPFQDVKGKPEHQVRVRFPLAPGKTWSSRYEWVNGRGHHGQMELDYAVGSLERITVPAGTFDALPVEAKGTWRNFTTGASGIAMEKRWYAPAARAMVRRTWVTRYASGLPDQNAIVELQSFELKP